MAWQTPDTYTVGEILTAASMNKVSGDLGYSHQWDYVAVTGNVAVSATTEGTANVVATGNSVTYDGTRVCVEFFAPEVGAGVNSSINLNALMGVFLRDTTVLGQVYLSFGKWLSGASDGFNTPAASHTMLFDTPGAGSHQYIFKAFQTNGVAPAGAINAGTAGSGNLLNAFLRVTSAIV